MSGDLTGLCLYMQVVINCQYYVAQLCTREDTLAYISGTLFIDNSLTTKLIKQKTIIEEWHGCNYKYKRRKE